MTDLSVVEKAIGDIDNKVTDLVNSTNERIEDAGSHSKKHGEEIKALSETIEVLNETVADLQQEGVHINNSNAVQSVGEQVVASQEFKNFSDRSARSALIEIENNTLGTDHPDVGDNTTWSERKSGIIGLPNRALRIESVIPQSNTSSNVIDYMREATFVNNAAEVAEKALKPETDITFSKDTANIKTIAHWMKVSKQLRDDAPLIISYINGRMRYGLELRCDEQVLLGDGIGDNLLGLLATPGTTYTAYALDALATGDVGAGVLLEQLREAITLVELADYRAEAIIMNPQDVMRIDLDQDTTGIYIASDPRMFNAPVAWGLPIVVSNTMPAGQFLVGAFSMATEIFNRQGIQVEMFEQDENNVQTNLMTIRAELRKGIAHYRPASLVGGAFA